MKINKKFKHILALLLLVVGLFFYFGNIEAYETGSTHPFLTKQIANLYNQIYTPKLTEEEIKQMIEGSVDEDTTPRWVNHFYDPTTGDGLLGKRLGDLPSEDIVTVIKIVFNEIPDSTLNWVHNQESQQNNYALFEGNKTFESAALSYVDGKNSEAYYNLGYVLHNIEDMAVPAHTRQDSHFDMPVPELVQNLLQIKLDKGEPYEKWAESYTRYNPADLTEKLSNNYKPICNSLDDCLKIIANYSNNDFFSSDTINDEEYELPKVNNSKLITEDGRSIKYYYDSDNNLLGRAIFLEEENEFSPIYIDYEKINQAYWDKLAPKVVLAGVEVVRYFKDQAEKAKKGEITIERVSETIDPIADFKEFSPYGQAVLMYNEGKTSVLDFWHKLTNFGKDFINRFKETISGLGLSVFTTSVSSGLAEPEVVSVVPNSSLPSLEPSLDATTVAVKQDDLQDYSGTGGANY